MENLDWKFLWMEYQTKSSMVWKKNPGHEIFVAPLICFVLHRDVHDNDK